MKFSQTLQPLGTEYCQYVPINLKINQSENLKICFLIAWFNNFHIF